MRWADPARGQGKSGGLRIIYVYIEQAELILFLAAYDKNIPDLTPQQQKVV